MKNQGAFVLALGVALLFQGTIPGLAAKKYYPPGFTPPSSPGTSSGSGSKAEPAPQVIIQQLPGTKQIIIKTVPVSKPAAARDPLLVLLDEHRYYDALRLVDERLKKRPNDLSLQLMRGRILRDEGDYSHSIQQFESILNRSTSKSSRAAAYNGLGWTYYEKSKRDKQGGDTAGFNVSLAAADHAFRQATQLLPNYSYAWAGLGQVALDNGQLKEAEQCIKKARRLAPNNLTVQLSEAELLIAKNQPEEALQILYGIKKTTTHEPQVFFLLAKASLDTGRTDDAIINLKQLLALVPNHPEGLKLLSQSYELKMKPEDAAEALEKAVALNPTDSQSVDSLLKIYDQRNQQDRSVLLLKTLLRDHPSQAAYSKALLERLIATKQWDEAYQEGSQAIEPLLKNSAEPQEQKQAVVYLFAQAVHQKGRGMLNPCLQLEQPPVQAAYAFSRERLEAEKGNTSAPTGSILQNKLNLVLLDPLVKINKLPETFMPETEKQLSQANQLAFLQGNIALLEKMLRQAALADNALDIARQLYLLGDYQGSEWLANEIIARNTPEKAEAIDLKQQIATDQKAMREQLDSLAILPRRVSDSHWEQAATEALRLGSANWKTHAAVAKMLDKRKEPKLALLHQRLAAKYAPPGRDRNYWEKKARKNAEKLADRSD